MADLLKAAYQAPLWGRRVVAQATTRMAIPWTRLFLLLGLSPNAVSWLAFAISVAGAAAVALDPFPYGEAAGAAALMLGLLWDHSDGQVARALGRRSAQGGLLDSLLDRWVEAAWAAALGYGAVARDGEHAAALGVAGAALAALWLVHALYYFRYSATSRTQALLLAEVRRAPRAPDGGIRLEAPGEAPAPPPKAFGLPFHFERDTIFWLLFAATLVPWWDLAMAALGGVLVLRGLEINRAAMGELAGGQSRLAIALDPDNH